ncbi:hypothetical protein B3C1_03415 [Gallaecimonas xiamenensis 3-C-1]|uniref:Uncharacterized protein n=1 Tax=Gallaecimonas xiamenensis 3-C-1 TaxID=745411 RepID=K2KH65_9GAMM|nr:hypothetical protein B3C1_03415 [Gallaecimonas xiamenensis 3-C-1]
MSLSEVGEIRRAIDIANSQARRRGKQPLDPVVTRFSCTCHCFSVNVEK